MKKEKDKADKPQGPAIYGKMPRERTKSTPMNALGRIMTPYGSPARCSWWRIGPLPKPELWCCVFP